MFGGHRSSGSLGIGLGRATSVASFNGPDGNPPYYVSSGNGSDEDELVFYYQGTWTEFAPGSAVPVEDARAAMTSFFGSGQLPGEISWTET